MNSINGTEVCEKNNPNYMTSNQHPSFSLFPNGTSFMIWSERNCDRCVKGYDENKHSNGESDCDIENAIAKASVFDGTLLHSSSTPMNKADAIAKRLKWDGRSYLQHDCPEFVP